MSARLNIADLAAACQRLGAATYVNTRDDNTVTLIVGDVVCGPFPGPVAPWHFAYGRGDGKVTFVIRPTPLADLAADIVALHESERPDYCEHCDAPAIDQTKFEGFICADCYDEALADWDADRAYDNWRDMQMEDAR